MCADLYLKIYSSVLVRKVEPRMQREFQNVLTANYANFRE